MKLKKLLFYLVPLLLFGLFFNFLYTYIGGGGTTWGRLIFRHQANEYLQKKYPALQYKIEHISCDFKSPNYYGAEIKPSDDTINFYVDETRNGLTDNYPFKHWENEVSDECYRILKDYNVNAKCNPLIWLDSAKFNFQRPFPSYDKVKNLLRNSHCYTNISIEFNSTFIPENDLKKLLEIHKTIRNKQLVSSYQYGYKNFEISIGKHDTIETIEDLFNNGHQIKY